MGVTSKLVALYRVDQQLRGLRSRLNSAEQYLKQQDQVLAQLDASRESLSTRKRLAEASEQNDENESNSIDERITELRDRMNNAQTSKEHSALLTEINTLKADKELIDNRAIESLDKLEELRSEIKTIEDDHAERLKMRKVAVKDRDEKKKEISGRLGELETERETVLQDVPTSALSIYDDRLALGVDDVMAPVEEQSRRNLEYTCGSCFTHLPIEQVSVLLKRGDVTRCPTCEAILFIETGLRDEITSAQEKKRKRSSAAAEK